MEVFIVADAPVVNKDECIGCGNCVDACPEDVLELKDGVAEVVYPEKCTQCGSCVEACPVDAITL